jgi:hypothetical protein
MTYVTEQLGNGNVVTSDGDVKPEDDYTDPAGGYRELEEYTRDTTESDELTADSVAAMERYKRQCKIYDGELEAALDKYPSHDRARAYLDSKGITEPLPPELESAKAVFPKDPFAEAIRLATLEEVLAAIDNDPHLSEHERESNKNRAIALYNNRNR